jgi:hypothetical protein
MVLMPVGIWMRIACVSCLAVALTAGGALAADTEPLTASATND